MSDQIRLRWTSHQGTILSVLDALLSSESLVDVTLACDGQYIRAHKLILSACSPYFQELLNVDANKHPIFFLNNIKFTELQPLIQYMYRGEVNIAREDLPSLLQLAQALKIRGLADVETTTNQMSSDMLILPDSGRVNRLNPPSAPLATLLHQPPQIPITSTPNAHFPRNFQQTHSFASPNVNSTLASPIIATAPSSAPPPAKKTRTETATRPSAQTAQVQNESHLLLGDVGDARIVVHRLPSARIDPLQSEPSTNPSFHFSGQSQVTGYENQEIEQPGFSGEVKEEEDSGRADVDWTGEDEDDDENSMSQSGFSESWQLDEGETSKMAEDDGEVPGGSGSPTAKTKSVTNGRRTGGGGAGGKGGMISCPACHQLISSKRRMHMLYDCPKIPGRFKCEMCQYAAKRKYNLMNHQKRVHHKIKLTKV